MSRWTAENVPTCGLYFHISILDLWLTSFGALPVRDSDRDLCWMSLFVHGQVRVPDGRNLSHYRFVPLADLEKLHTYLHVARPTGRQCGAFRAMVSRLNEQTPEM